MPAIDPLVLQHPLELGASGGGEQGVERRAVEGGVERLGPEGRDHGDRHAGR